MNNIILYTYTPWLSLLPLSTLNGYAVLGIWSPCMCDAVLIYWMFSMHVPLRTVSWYWRIELCAVTWAGPPNWAIISLKYLGGLSNEARTSMRLREWHNDCGNKWRIDKHVSRVLANAKWALLVTTGVSTDVSLRRYRNQRFEHYSDKKKKVLLLLLLLNC